MKRISDTLNNNFSPQKKNDLNFNERNYESPYKVSENKLLPFSSSHSLPFLTS